MAVGPTRRCMEATVETVGRAAGAPVGVAAVAGVHVVDGTAWQDCHTSTSFAPHVGMRVG